MDTRVSVFLAAALAVAIGADLLLTGGEGLLFMARKFLHLLDWVAFWR